MIRDEQIAPRPVQSLRPVQAPRVGQSQAGVGAQSVKRLD